MAWSNDFSQPTSSIVSLEFVENIINDTDTVLVDGDLVFIHPTKDTDGQYYAKKITDITVELAAYNPIIGVVNIASVAIGGKFSIARYRKSATINNIDYIYAGNDLAWYLIDVVNTWSAQIDQSPNGIVLGRIKELVGDGTYVLEFNPKWAAEFVYKTQGSNAEVSGAVIDNTISDPTLLKLPGRYIVPVSETIDSFAGQEGNYVSWNGNVNQSTNTPTNLKFTIPLEGDKIIVTTGPNAGVTYEYISATWQAIGSSSSTQANWNEEDPASSSYILNKPALSAVSTTGSYNDLGNKPDLAQYAVKTELAQVATSGNYQSLSNRPDLTLYATRVELSPLAYSGLWADIQNKPNFSNYVLTSQLSTVAGTGSYTDLLNKPDFSLYALNAALSSVSFSGNYAELNNKPNLALYAVKTELSIVATTGNYTDLIGLPNLSLYALTSSLGAAAISNSYTDLSNKPDLAQYILKSLIGQAGGIAPLDPISGKIDSQYINISALIPKGKWNASTNTPTLTDGLGSNGWLYLVDIPGTQDLGSGVQNFEIGDAVVYFSDSATWERIGRSDSVVSVNGKLGAVNLTTEDILESATGGLYFTPSRAQEAQIQTDWLAVSGKGSILNKPNFAAVAFSGNYAELSGLPNLTVYALSSNLATVATSGKYADLTGTPTLSVVAKTGSYNDLSDKPQGTLLQEFTVDPLSPAQGSTYLYKTLDVPDGELTSFYGSMPMVQDGDSNKFYLTAVTSEGLKRSELV